MKIKYDFISNSSSTSFIYISEYEFSKDMFFKAIGISINSPLHSIFEHFYTVLKDNISDGKVIKDINEIHSSSFTMGTINRIKLALKQGQKVILGSLESAGDIAESYLCMEFFEIESDEFYINAFDNYW